MSLLSSSIILLLISVSLCSCTCDIKWPNGTDKALHWWQCGPSPITVYNISILDMNGKPEYPIYLTAPIQAWADIDDPNITVTNPNLKANVNIWSWNDKDCSWASVPTFGLLKNLNGCDYTKCPINPGRQWISGVIDFSEFQPIINIMKDNMPYQLELNLVDEASKATVCGFAQAWARTKND